MIARTDIDRLSTSERLEVMESLWQSLCASPASIASPAWHIAVLDLRSDPGWVRKQLRDRQP